MKKGLYSVLIGICAIGLSVQVHGQTIAEKEWMLVEMGKEKITADAGKTPFIMLSENRLSGFSSCNRLVGSYVLDGETLTFSRIGSTKMLCEAVRDLETTFIQSLEKTRYWKYKCKKLCLFDENKVLIMKFKIKK